MPYIVRNICTRDRGDLVVEIEGGAEAEGREYAHMRARTHTHTPTHTHTHSFSLTHRASVMGTAPEAVALPRVGGKFSQQRLSSNAFTLVRTHARTHTHTRAWARARARTHTRCTLAPVHPPIHTRPHSRRINSYRDYKGQIGSGITTFPLMYQDAPRRRESESFETCRGRE